MFDHYRPAVNNCGMFPSWLLHFFFLCVFDTLLVKCQLVTMDCLGSNAMTHEQQKNVRTFTFGLDVINFISIDRWGKRRMSHKSYKLVGHLSPPLYWSVGCEATPYTPGPFTEHTGAYPVLYCPFFFSSSFIWICFYSTTRTTHAKIHFRWSVTSLQLRFLFLYFFVFSLFKKKNFLRLSSLGTVPYPSWESVTMT